MTVCDAVYGPGGETGLIRLAKELGLRAVPGERMLLYQGVQAQRMWTGQEPDGPAMSDARSQVPTGTLLFDNRMIRLYATRSPSVADRDDLDHRTFAVQRAT